MNFEKCSLIIVTYNWSKALDFCLQSVLRQSHLPDEVIIADDGSNEQTLSLINKYQKTFPIQLIHVWHEDKGFRLTTIRNKGIAIAKYPYIIQIDGDILLDPHFIEDHLRFAKRNYFVRGSRSLLNEKFTKEIFENEAMPDIGFLLKNCEHKLNSKRNLLIARFMRNKYKTRGKNYFNVIGCNMAYWKDDAIRINGYNEALIGWGCEDIEFSLRMLKAGVKKQSLKMAGVAFHLFHKQSSRDSLAYQQQIFEQIKNGDKYTCELGINQYL